MVDKSCFAIVRATLNTKIYHYSEVIDGKVNIYCGQHFKEGTDIDIYVNISPEIGRICKKCKIQELQR